MVSVANHFLYSPALGPPSLASKQPPAPYKLGVFLPINHTTAHNAPETMNSLLPGQNEWSRVERGCRRELGEEEDGGFFLAPPPPYSPSSTAV